jgi:solute carrier family 25 (mitochondrial uncoupling protein), member 8/9
VLSNPLDVVSTRLMAAKKAHDPNISTLGMIVTIWQREGFWSFYKGFGPNVLRIGAFNIVLWLSYEQIRKIGR